MKKSKELFTEHPNEVGMSYSEHFAYALTVTARLAIGTIACLIHAFFPFLFTTTISELVANLHNEFNAHSRHKAHEPEQTSLFED